MKFKKGLIPYESSRIKTLAIINHLFRVVEKIWAYSFNKYRSVIY